jgi:exopolysaccharide production protein ExoQ
VSSGIAAAVFMLGIFGLLLLDRDKGVRTSKALWMPVIWVSLACSRSLGQWLSMAPAGSADEVADGSPFDRLIYGGLLVVGLIVLVSRPSVGRLLRENKPIIVCFLYCAVSLVWSDFPGVALKRWSKGVGDLVMVLIVLSEAAPLTAMKNLLARIAFLLVPLSVLFIKYYPNLGRSYSAWDGALQLTGVTTNKNTLGAVCLLFGLASAWRFFAVYQDRDGVGRTRHLLAHGIVLTMTLWLFSLANSMTSFSCFVVGVTLLLAAKFRAVVQRPAVIHFLVASMVSVCVCALFFATSLLKLVGRNPTLTDRTDVWALLLRLSSNPVFGTGFESFWLGPRLRTIWSVYAWRPSEAHNGYLEIFLNLGWLGVVMLSGILVIGYRRVIATFRSNPSIGSLMLAYFVVGLIYNCTEAAFFRMMAPVWIFFLFAITMLPEAAYSETEKHNKVSPQGISITQLKSRHELSTNVAGMTIGLKYRPRNIGTAGLRTGFRLRRTSTTSGKTSAP